MSYNKEALPHYMKTAGKVSLAAVFIGVCVFLFALMVDVGNQELQRVSAQTATTSLTVLNTPPYWAVEPFEVVESSTSTPTNSGDVVQWQALGVDSNNAPYFLLICSTNASPTANAAPGAGSLGTAAPECGGGVTWGVSTGTPSNTVATVSTTTSEAAGTLFEERNAWYAWVCDDDPVQPACINIPSQGIYATSSSPFHMNQRPVLTNVTNSSPVDPGAELTFFSTSTDPDIIGGADILTLIACQDVDDYSSSTNSCPNSFLGSTSVPAISDVTATYTLAAIVRDGSYPAYGFLVDEHGHEATSPIQSDFDVNNVAPRVLGGDIDLNGGLDITLTNIGGETNGFTLDFTVSDANSCVNAASSSEIIGYEVSVFRSSYGTTTCDGTAGSYDPNYCYPSGIATTTWDLDCTAVAASCESPADDTQEFTCTFPLWFLADPTESGINTPAAFAADSWSAAVAGGDDNYATSSMSTTSSPVELNEFAALDLITAEIPYGALAPGDDSGTLSTTTTILNVGNTGLDQEAQGDSMCGTYTTLTTCPVSASSTIPESEQQFSSTTLAYGSVLATTLSSTTANEVELDVLKTTSTSTPQTGDTYWGIAVPASITVAGSYQGMNTFYAITAEAADW